MVFFYLQRLQHDGNVLSMLRGFVVSKFLHNPPKVMRSTTSIWRPRRLMRKNSRACPTAPEPSVTWIIITAFMVISSASLTQLQEKSMANIQRRPVITSWDAHILVSVIMNMQVWKSYTTGESNLALEKKEELGIWCLSRTKEHWWPHWERTVQPCALGCYYIWWRWQCICFQRWVSYRCFIQTAL